MADQREAPFEPSVRNEKCAVRAFGGARLTLMRNILLSRVHLRKKRRQRTNADHGKDPNARKEGLLT